MSRKLYYEYLEREDPAPRRALERMKKEAECKANNQVLAQIPSSPNSPTSVNTRASFDSNSSPEPTFTNPQLVKSSENRKALLMHIQAISLNSSRGIALWTHLMRVL